MFPNLSDIKLIRERIGWSQVDLAKRVGITQSAITKYEKGIQVPSYVTAKKMFEILMDADLRIDPDVSELMTVEVITITRQTKYGEALRIMKEKGLSQLPVVENRTVIGTVSEGSTLDLIEKSRDIESLKDTPVDEIMGDMLPAVPITAKLAEITPLLRHYGAILVIEKGKLIGIVTKADLLSV